LVAPLATADPSEYQPLLGQRETALRRNLRAMIVFMISMDRPAILTTLA